jgi:Tfp pilus assembly protein PilO
MTYKLLRQVIILGLSIAIIFAFIQPKLVELRDVQAEIDEYTTAVNNATQFTNELQSQLNQINSISRADEQALETFLPRTIDAVVISRDLQTIAQRNSMRVETISYAEPVTEETVRSIQDPSFDTSEAAAEDIEPILTRTPVTITVQGSYESFIGFLRSLEANVYPLRVTNIAVSFAEPSEELRAVITEPIGAYTVTLEATSMEIPI